VQTPKIASQDATFRAGPPAPLLCESTVPDSIVFLNFKLLCSDLHELTDSILSIPQALPAHTIFELSLIASLVTTWGEPAVRTALLVAMASHLVMRLWSAFDFIPKALAFERVDPTDFDVDAALRWRWRSLGRLPLDLVTCGAMLIALVNAARAL